MLQRLFYVDFGGTRPSGSDVPQPKNVGFISNNNIMNNDHIGGYQAAIPMLSGIESKFGLSLPRFSTITLKHQQKSNSDSW